MNSEKQISDEAQNTEYLDKLKKIHNDKSLLFEKKAEQFQQAIENAKEAGVPLEEIIKTLKKLKNNKPKS